MADTNLQLQRWPEVRALFESALSVPSAAREAFVRERGDAWLVERVLGLLKDEATQLDATLGAPPDAPLLSVSTIGDYRILRPIGRGGMGVVYLAEQMQPRRQVAIKLLTGALTDQTLARFRREADLLARLSHPGIAQVFELGQHDNGTPYLVMEYVDGQHLGEYVRALDRAGQLKLLARIADAVEHAHSRGVVHRDLKPSNILVGKDGQPKILDFGIGFLFDGESLTATGAVLGTPAYMSPEQAQGREGIDARADVYALGAIGYELLTGRVPVPVGGLTPMQAVQRVIHDTPLSIGRVDASLRGDLEVVIDTALARESSLRYVSAGAFADDLRRYLEREPIRARRASRMRRIWLAAQRNPKLAFAVALASISMIAGTLFSAYFAVDARRQAEKAIAQAQTAEAIQQFLIDSYTRANPYNTDGRIVTARDLLEDGAARAQTDLADQPAIRAALHATFGRVFADLEQRPQAEREFQLALAYFQSAPDPDPAQILQLRAALAEQQYYRGDVNGALAAFQSLREETRSLPELADLHADMHTGQVMAYLDLGRYREAVALTRNGLLPLLERTVDEGDYRYAFTIYNEANAWLFDLHPIEALARIERVLALDRAHLEPGHPGLITDVQFVAMLLHDFGLANEATALARQALDMRQRHYRADDTMVASARGRLAVILSGAGQFAEAEGMFRQAIGDFRRQRGSETDDIARLRRDFGLALIAVGRDREAAEQFAIAMQTWTTLDAAHPEAMRCAAQLQGIAARAERADAMAELGSIMLQQRSGQHSALADSLLLMAGLSSDSDARALRAEALQMFIAQGRIRLARTVDPAAALEPTLQARVQATAAIAQTVLAGARAAVEPLQ